MIKLKKVLKENMSDAMDTNKTEADALKVIQTEYLKNKDKFYWMKNRVGNSFGILYYDKDEFPPKVSYEISGTKNRKVIILQYKYVKKSDNLSKYDTTPKYDSLTKNVTTIANPNIIESIYKIYDDIKKNNIRNVYPPEDDGIPPEDDGIPPIKSSYREV